MAFFMVFNVLIIKYLCFVVAFLYMDVVTLLPLCNPDNFFV